MKKYKQNHTWLNQHHAMKLLLNSQVGLLRDNRKKMPSLSTVKAA